MAQSKSKAGKTTKKAAATRPATRGRAKTTASPKETREKPDKPKAAKQPTEPLVVFAIRLTEAERTEIHEAAGPRNATKFVRGIVVASARGDLETIRSIVEGAKADPS